MQATTKAQKTIYGYNVRQIMKRIRIVETIGKKKKRVFCLRHPSSLTNVGFNVMEETGHYVIVASGSKMWKLINR